MSHECVCRSSVRPIALVFGNLTDQNSELDAMIDRFAESWHPDLATAVFRVGAGAPIGGVAELGDLVSGVAGCEITRHIRAAWLESGPVTEQMGRLLRAEPLDRFAPSRDSPLAGILENRRIHTWFQPIFDRDCRLWGYECLMRAFDADGATISPGQLIAWARSENLLFMLDRVCRETHIASAGALDAPAGSRFLLNFLPSVIYRPEFCLRSTVEALRGTQLTPERIVFEVVETEAITDHDHLRSILEYYRSSGFGVALDDVTAGYSGLALMADLDPDLLKIDRQIVGRAAESKRHADICRSIVNLGRSGDKRVLAEGIETRAQLECMRDIGVDLFQGFLLGRPGPEAVTAPLGSCSPSQ